MNPNTFFWHKPSIKKCWSSFLNPSLIKCTFFAHMSGCWMITHWMGEYQRNFIQLVSTVELLSTWYFGDCFIHFQFVLFFHVLRISTISKYAGCWLPLFLIFFQLVLRVSTYLLTRPYIYSVSNLAFRVAT